jgi:di/tricarboxylate transporter
MEQYIIIIILVFTMILFIWGRWRYDIVALIALFIATAAGAVPLKEVYMGLPNPAVITVACVMVISQTLTRSGVLNQFINKLDFMTENLFLHITSLCFMAMILSFFMNNVGALALIMPIAIKTAIKHKRSPAIFLMPIAFCSGLGGLTTMIGTPPNLLVAAYRGDIAGHAFSMFDFFPVGIIVALVGFAFIVTIGYRLLPIDRKSPKNVADMFKISDYIFEVRVTSKSTILGKSNVQLHKDLEVDYSLVGLIRAGRKYMTFPKNIVFRRGDILIIQATTERLKEFMSATKTLLATEKPITGEALKTKETSLIEAVVPQGSRTEGRSGQSMGMKARLAINLIAISREGKPFKNRLNNVKLKAGDIILFQGPSETIQEDLIVKGFVPLIERDIEVKSSWKRYLPFLVFLAAIIATALQVIPVQAAFGGAVVIMVVCNMIPARMLYEAIDWPIIILLAAMIPIGSALQTTGGTALISGWITHSAHHLEAPWVLVIMMVVTMTISDFMNNAATAIVMAPIAVSIANSLGTNIDPFLMGVAVASSCSFLTPVGHQNNTLVMGPGGYRFLDYIRLGLPIEIIVLLVSVPTILWIWPLR